MSEGHLPSDSDSSIKSQVPQVHSRREGLGVQGSLLRSVHSASGVHTGHGFCVWFPPPVWHSDASLSGQLIDSCFVSQGSLLGKGQGPKSLSRLGTVVNLEKSSLVLTQISVYLGIKIELQTLRASLTPLRIKKFFSVAKEFLSSKVQSAKFWRVLLGHLVSLTHLVLGGQLWMRALQLASNGVGTSWTTLS